MLPHDLHHRASFFFRPFVWCELRGKAMWELLPQELGDFSAVVEWPAW